MCPGQVTERVSGVDEDRRVGDEHPSEMGEGSPLCGRVPSVEDPDPACEGQVVERLIGKQPRLLRAGQPDGDPPSGDLLGARSFGRGDRSGRTVEDEDVALRPHSAGDLSRGRPGGPADLDDAEPGTQGEGIDGGAQPR